MSAAPERPAGYGWRGVLLLGHRIDAAVRELHKIRGRLTAEIRAADNATVAWADEQLRRRDPPVSEDADTPKTDRFPDPM